MKSIVILISGRGSNMRAILDAGLPARIAAVISNRPAAEGLAVAARKGIPTAVVDHTRFSSREAFDAALAEEIERHQADLVVLAGFMRVLSAAFVDRFAGRLMNIHPSLLPAFPGLHTHRRALEAGVRIHGCTVHFVTSALDNGPIVIQAAVPVFEGDTEDELSARVLDQEHVVYPQAVRWFVEGRLTLTPEGRVRIEDAPRCQQRLVAPPADLPEEPGRRAAGSG